MKIIVIVAIEVALVLVFWGLKMYKKHKIRDVSFSIIKGLIERSFLCFGLFMNLPLVIIFFSALKLGTRLNADNTNKNDKLSNDQFLIGNILSLSASIFYMVILKENFCLNS